MSELNQIHDFKNQKGPRGRDRDIVPTDTRLMCAYKYNFDKIWFFSRQLELLDEGGAQRSRRAGRRPPWARSQARGERVPPRRDALEGRRHSLSGATGPPRAVSGPWAPRGHPALERDGRRCCCFCGWWQPPPILKTMHDLLVAIVCFVARSPGLEGMMIIYITLSV